MSITSLDFQDGETVKIKNVFNGCGGENVPPQITIHNAPKDTKSFAITMFDPDAPTESGWWHWIVYNISSKVTNIVYDNDQKKAAEVFGPNVEFGRNDYNTFEYGGPCPPVGHGKHRYILTVHALKVEKLDVPQGAPAGGISFNINENVIEKASITSYYERKSN